MFTGLTSFSGMGGLVERAKQLSSLIKPLIFFGVAWRGVAAAVVRTRLLKEVTQQLSYLVPLGAVKTGGYTQRIHRYLPNI